MSSQKADPLLAAGKFLAIFIQGVTAIAGVALLVATPLVLIFQDRIHAEIQADHAETLAAFPAWPLAGLFVLLVAVLAMTFVFFGKLRAIIGTVGDRDPFVPENAKRLNTMAWLLLSIQVLVIPAAGLGLLFAKWADQLENSDFTVDVGLDVEGILMVIVLFILARVFKQGAAMREDLEGTV